MSGKKRAAKREGGAGQLPKASLSAPVVAPMVVIPPPPVAKIDDEAPVTPATATATATVTRAPVQAPPPAPATTTVRCRARAMVALLAATDEQGKPLRRVRAGTICLVRAEVYERAKQHLERL